MKVPKGMTEAEVLESIERVARGLAGKFKFGYNELEDMKQYARMYALTGLDNYDPSIGTLETFLWTHVRNRLFNLKRDNFERPDKPCLNCPLKAYDPHCAASTNQCTAYDDKMACEQYAKWHNRNSAKRNVISPIELGNVRDEYEDNMKVSNDVAEELDNKHIMDLLDQKIPVTIRHLWVRVKSGISINKADRDKLYPTIHEILEKEGIDGT
jgi:DNA-directed RNA polymerase specialized sigma subunit